MRFSTPGLSRPKTLNRTASTGEIRQFVSRNGRFRLRSPSFRPVPFDLLPQTSSNGPATQQKPPTGHRESSRSRSALSRLRFGALPFSGLGFVWFTLINHLRIEWAVNPQYGYGWAVPFLSLYLIWRNRQGPRPLDYKTTDDRTKERRGLNI